MEIIYVTPKQPYKVIGRFNYSHTFTVDGEDYVDEVLRYNGRKAGADAVYVVDKKIVSSSEKGLSGEVIEPRQGRAKEGEGQAPEEKHDEFSTGLNQKKPTQTVSIDAEMIVYLKKP